MGKMKKVIVTAMLAVLVVIATACGRSDNGNKTTTAPTTAPTTEQTMTPSTTPTSEQTMTPSTSPTIEQTTTQAPMESGGVLQDMVDGVEQGMDNMLDGGTNETADQTYENVNDVTTGKK